MAKTLSFEYEGRQYTLEYTRDTVRQLERQGLVADEISQKPNLYIPELWAGAFLAHHRWVKRTKIDEIYAHMGNKAALISKLVEMYRQPLVELLGGDDDDEAAGDEGNVVEWTGNW